jgi:hypothetical protein
MGGLAILSVNGVRAGLNGVPGEDLGFCATVNAVDQTEIQFDLLVGNWGARKKRGKVGNIGAHHLNPGMSMALGNQIGIGAAKTAARPAG